MFLKNMLFDSTVIFIDLHDPQTGLSVLSLNLAQQTRLSQSKALAEKATSEQARADNQLALKMFIAFHCPGFTERLHGCFTEGA